MIVSLSRQIRPPETVDFNPLGHGKQGFDKIATFGCREGLLRIKSFHSVEVTTSAGTADTLNEIAIRSRGPECG